MSEGEVWKDITGYEGLYKVSNKGNIFSLERKNSRGNKCGGRTLRPAYHRDGYIYAVLCKNGIRKNKMVHRLVAEAFLHNPKKYPDVNHLDENKENNELSNLEWCTREYNVNYGTRAKRVSQTLSKKVRAVNVETGEVLTFNSAKEAISEGYYYVSAACRGVYKNVGGKLIGDGHLYRGYKWSYE